MSSKKSFLLRLSPGIWQELEAWAEEEFRSVNGQIEYLLDRAIRERRKSRAKQHEVNEEEK